MAKIIKPFFYILIVFIILLSSIISPAIAIIQNHSEKQDISNVDSLTTIDQNRGGKYQYYYETLNWTGFEVWNITDDEFIVNENRTFTKSIVIKSGGSLTIDNSEIFINSSDAPILITVENASSLIINNSQFTLKNIKSEIGYKFFIYGDLFINNSEFKYLGYLMNVCIIETCSGTSSDPEFSEGIELFSDGATIKNSKIKFSLSTGILVNGSSEHIINNNYFSNNTHAISIINANRTNTLFNNVFIDNYIGIGFENSNVEIINANFTSTYFDSSSISLGGYKSEIYIQNCTIRYSDIGFYFEKSDIEIYNSFIYNIGYIGIYNSYFHMEGSTIRNVYELFSLNNVTSDIRNCTFTQSEKGIEIISSQNFIFENNQFSSIESWGLEIRGCINISIKNNYFNNNIIGLFIISSYIEIMNNEIKNSSFVGIDCEYVEGNIKNNNILNNDAGIILNNFNGKILNNTITNNNNGILIEKSIAYIEDNLIANNSEWGINISEGEISITKNSYSSVYHSPNNLGRLIKTKSLKIIVKDQYGQHINSFNLIITGKKSERTVFNQRVTGYGPYQTVLTEYFLSNSNKMSKFDEYIITVGWGNEEVYPSDTKTINILTVNEVNFTIRMPDLYIDPSDIVISNEKPKSEEEIEIKATIHYNGDIPAENITVFVSANKVKIDEFTLNFPASEETQEKTINLTWTVSKHIPSPMGINIEIKPNDVENRILGYDKNNSAGKIIYVKKEYEDDSDWTDESGAIVCGIIMLVVIVIVLSIIYLMFRGYSNKGRTDQIPEAKKREPQKPGQKELPKKKTLKIKLQDERSKGPRIKW
jgi:hypothetical protein